MRAGVFSFSTRRTCWVVDAEVVLGGAATEGGPNEEEGEALGGASDSCTCRTVDLL